MHGVLTAVSYTTGAPLVRGGSSTIHVSQGSGLGLASAVGLLADVAVLILVAAFVGAFIIVVVANRADPDPTARRPQSVYFFAVSYVTLLTSIIGSSAMVWSFTRYIGNKAGSIDDSVARTVVLAGLLTIVSVGLLAIHLRRGVALARAGAEATTPSRRVGQSYVAAVYFFAVLVLLAVGVFSVYLLFALASPSVFGSFGGRSLVGRYLIDSVYLGALLGVVLWTHRDLVPPGIHLFAASSEPDASAEGGAGGVGYVEPRL
jgi:hypothetical protein